MDSVSSPTKCLDRLVRLSRKCAKLKDLPLASHKGKRMTYRTIYEKMNELGTTSSIGKRMLRHTYLTRLHNVEGDLPFVQGKAGRANLVGKALHQYAILSLLPDAGRALSSPASESNIPHNGITPLRTER